MPIVDLFSLRAKRAKQAQNPDPYRYDVLPASLRTQIVHIWGTSIGFATRERRDVYGVTPPAEEVWPNLTRSLAREYGRVSIGKGATDAQRCIHHLEDSDVPEALDIIEQSFVWIDGFMRRAFGEAHYLGYVSQDPDDAIDELNRRFAESGVGYAFSDGRLIRIDSQYLHAAAVVPAITLLRDQKFHGAEAEFSAAHEHYRHGRNKECLNEALKAFESTMKTIATRKKWEFDPTAPANKLIDVMVKKGLIPPFIQNHLNALRESLVGLPTLRNKLGGHGQGEKEVEVDAHFAAYALHLAATNIVFLVECFDTM